MLDFLGTCAEPAEPTTYRFGLLDAPTVSVRDSDVAELKRRFGDLAISADRADEAVAFLEEIQPPAPDRALGHIMLFANTTFTLLDPRTGIPIPGQDPERYGGVEFSYGSPLGTSSTRLSLGHSAALALDLSIPDMADDELARVVNEFQERLPFAFSPKHWKRWTATKTGSFIGRKIPMPLMREDWLSRRPDAYL